MKARTRTITGTGIVTGISNSRQGYNQEISIRSLIIITISLLFFFVRGHGDTGTLLSIVANTNGFRGFFCPRGCWGHLGTVFSFLSDYFIIIWLEYRLPCIVIKIMTETDFRNRPYLAQGWHCGATTWLCVGWGDLADYWPYLCVFVASRGYTGCLLLVVLHSMCCW